MRDEYNISELNPRKNPYASRLKKQSAKADNTSAFVLSFNITDSWYVIVKVLTISNDYLLATYNNGIQLIKVYHFIEHRFSCCMIGRFSSLN